VQEFLAADCCCEGACLISDIRVSGTSGLALPGLLAARGKSIPTIYLTVLDDPATRREAQALGAVGFLRKPVDAQALLDMIHWALELAENAGTRRPILRAPASEPPKAFSHEIAEDEGKKAR